MTNIVAASDLEIFDTRTKAMQRIRARALQAQDPNSTFLIDEIADRLQDRLADIKRRFTHALDIGGNMKKGQHARHVCGLPAQHENLGLTPASYDLITSNLMLHWVTDLPGMLIQMNQALKPDGLMMVSLFGGETLHELRHSLIKAETEIIGGANMRISPMADVKDLGSLLQRAGFAMPVADMDTVTVHYSHPLKLMADLRAMGENNALKSRPKNFLRRDILRRACEIYMQTYSNDQGRIPATFQVMYLTGWHPHESQQQPLKPGSATMRFSDALGKPPLKS